MGEQSVERAVAEVESDILRSLFAGWVTSTFRVGQLVGLGTNLARYRLRSMAKRGVVEPVPYQRTGRVYHWRITDAGRAVIAKAEGR